MQDELDLPSELLLGAITHGLEYAWSVNSFPAALRAAPRLGYACLGGQVWFTPSPGQIYELYWAEADSSERLAGEDWQTFASRSCGEVAEKFASLVTIENILEAALKSESLEYMIQAGKDIGPPLFNAYFITEKEWIELQSARKTLHK